MDVEDLLQHQRDEDLVQVLQDHPAVQVVMMELVKDSSYDDHRKNHTGAA